MRFTEEAKIALETWVVSRLNRFNIEDAESLAPYVTSLLEQDRSNLKQYCQEELQTFLEGSTVEFIKDLFQVIHGKLTFTN